MKSILITGGAGFIGSHFVKYWYKNRPEYKIIVLDNLTYAGDINNIPDHIQNDKNRFEFWKGNVCTANLVDNLVSQSDIIVHFAAESHVARSIYDNKLFFETDVIGTLTIANAIVKFKKKIEKFVHISTSEVYGTAEYTPMDETHPLNPMSPYAAAKCGADRLVYSFIKTYNLPAVIIRPFNQYGPNQHLEKLIPRFITSALCNEPVIVHGDGSAKRDWLYVGDTCIRIHQIIDQNQNFLGNVYNIGSGEVYGVLEIANMILEILDKPKTLIRFIGDRPGQVDLHMSSTTKSEADFNMVKGKPFIEGLKRTIEWYKNNQNWWRSRLDMKSVKIKTISGIIEEH